MTKILLLHCVFSYNLHLLYKIAFNFLLDLLIYIYLKNIKIQWRYSMEKLIFLVKPDLILHEKTFEKLREYVESHDASKLNVNHYHTLEYSVEDDEIVYYPTDFSLYTKSEDLLQRKIVESGFILLNFKKKKKMLSL